MREVELPLRNRKLADAMGELRAWLDRNECTPVDFDISKRGNALVIRIIFADDELAEAFQRHFDG